MQLLNGRIVFEIEAGIDARDCYGKARWWPEAHTKAFLVPCPITCKLFDPLQLLLVSLAFRSILNETNLNSASCAVTHEILRFGSKAPAGMDKYVDSRFERLEKALSNLIDSVTKYHPSTIQAEELKAADIELSKGLEEGILTAPYPILT